MTQPQPQPLPLPLPRARAQPQARPPPLARKKATEIHPRDRHVVHVIRADPGEIPRLRPTPAWGGQNGKRRAPTQQFHALFSPLATPCALQAAAGGRTSSPPSPPPRLLACPPPPLRPGGHLTDVRADEGVEERDRRTGRPRPPTEHVGAARAPRGGRRGSSCPGQAGPARYPQQEPARASPIPMGLTPFPFLGMAMRMFTARSSEQRSGMAPDSVLTQRLRRSLVGWR